MMPARIAARGAALGVAALLLAACAQWPTRPSSGLITDVPWNVAPPSSTGLSSVYASERARVDVGERVWQLVADRFHDPRMNGVDWLDVRNVYLPRLAAADSDAALYRELKAMLAQLRDSHTQVLTPREAVDTRRFVAPRTGLTLGLIDERVAVIEVDADSPAAAAGLRRGDVLAAAAGVRFDAEFLRRALADPVTLRANAALFGTPEALPADERDARRVRAMRAVNGVIRAALEPGTGAAPALRIEVQRADGSSADVTLRPAFNARPPRIDVHWLDGAVLVLGFNRFHPDLRSELETALQTAAGARAVIIDLRGNGGGVLDMYRWFSGQFLADERTPMRTTRRERTAAGTQSVTGLRVGPGRRPLLQPLAVLTDGRTGSAAELTAITLAEQRNAILVGEPTCGCVVGVRVEYVMPDGGGVRIAESSFVSARGARMEGEPTQPDVRIVPSLDDLRAGRDVALDEAHRRLLTRMAR
jgi:C-terminal processing protease CtpA/Prc